MARHAASMLPSLVTQLALRMRDVLKLREPTRVAAVCLVLAQMLQVSPAFGKALVPEFKHLARSLSLFYNEHAVVDFGYNSRRQCSLHDCVDMVLQLLCASGGLRAGALIKRSIPLFTWAG